MVDWSGSCVRQALEEAWHTVKNELPKIVETYHVTWSPDMKYLTFTRGPKFKGKSLKGLLPEFPGIEAPEARTLRFHLDRPSPTFLNVLAMTFAAPVPRKLAAQPGTGNAATRI